MIDVVAVCDTPLNETPTLAITLSALFGVYVLVDSMLAAVAIVRKTSEAQKLAN